MYGEYEESVINLQNNDFFLTNSLVKVFDGEVVTVDIFKDIMINKEKSNWEDLKSWVQELYAVK